MAQEALTRLFSHFLPDAAEDGLVLMENKKWSTAARRNDLLAVLLESDSRRLAEDLLAEVGIKR